MAKNWVIPDIHGCKKTLKALIEEQIKPTKHDWLYFLGDYIDRGPDPKGVIDYVMHLQDEEYNVRMVKGNHEDYLLRLYANEKDPQKLFGIHLRNRLKKDWFKHGGKETLASFGVSNVHEIPVKYIRWFESLEYFIELEDYYLVHAGFNFDIENPFTDKHAMLWIKDFNVVPEKADNKKIVHGHVPVSLDFINLVNNTRNFDFIDLDNGVYMTGKEGFGNLVALELDSMELLIQHNLDF